MKALRVLVVLLLSGIYGAAADPVLAPDLLPQVGSLAPVRVIVQFKSSPSLLTLGQILALGGTLLAQLPIINGVLYSLPGTSLLLVALLPDVSYISADRK